MDNQIKTSNNSPIVKNGELLTLEAIETLVNEKRQIILVKSVKEIISTKTGLKIGPISVFISRLHKKGFLKNIGRATYEVPLLHPKL